MGKEKDVTEMKTVVSREELLNEYFVEMDQLMSSYPEDPNMLNASDEELNTLIERWDERWLDFQQRWKDILENADAVVGQARIAQDKNGMRHLIIKKGEADTAQLDLMVDASKAPHRP